MVVNTSIIDMQGVGMVLENPVPRGERLDFAATVFGCAVAVVFVIVHVVGVLGAGGVPSEAAAVAGPAAVAGGTALDMGPLAPVTLALLWSAFVLEIVLVVAVIALVAVVAWRCVKGSVFTPVTVRLVGASAWVLVAYLLVPPILAKLGGNLALRDLARTHLDVPGMDLLRFAVVYLFTMVLSLTWVAFRRGTVLRQDQEGLI